MTLACLRLLGQVQVYNPAIQREMLMLLVLLAVIGMVCLLGAARAIREPRKVLIVGASIVAVLLIVSVLASLAMLFFTPRAITYAARDEQSAAEARAATAEAESFRTSISSKVVVQSDESTAGSVAEGLPPRQQLFSDVVDTWQADVYPSDKAAVRALLVRLHGQINSLTANQGEPTLIQVQGQVRNALLVQAVDMLKKTHPHSRITFLQTDERVTSSSDKQAVFVHVTAGQEGQVAPFVRMEIVGCMHTVADQVSFENKLWVEDYATFANLNPGRAYVVAISQRPATSPEEARRNALEVAAQSLKDRVGDQMAPTLRGGLRRTSDADKLLTNRIVAELDNTPMIADQFSQRLQAPYGQVWQTSLLIDASPKNIISLAQRCDRWLAMQAKGTQRTALSVLGVLALVCLVYAGLNVLTRGYFVWSLRAMALAMIAGGVFLVLLFRR